MNDIDRVGRQLTILQWVSAVSVAAPWLVMFTSGYLLSLLGQQHYYAAMPWIALISIIGFPLFAVALCARFKYLVKHRAWSLSQRQEKKLRGVMHGIITLMLFYLLLYGFYHYARS